ncbi:MAG TPA: UDP-N-acetylglucosamine--N-acetylmuramyl-(pentapeptide) pyrophosphoryl-undecaprenol N-acetylglucosamine transferase [Candidatus Woesebacteria bacterium]|nr:UDP-N-acetylglucosamine--N-acetylmuramyl-(pentapeptide) pyrophosphoryl-undecaprenol N-acetylglucosamine transferase [Candidatus Woesebacteria bacterium]
MKIALIGGHLTPALAIADYIRQTHPEHYLIFFGRLSVRSSDNQPAHEYNEVRKRNIDFYAFNSGKFNNQGIFSIIKSFGLTLSAFVNASSLLIKHKPDVLVSFGSYLAVPMVIVSWILKIPVVTHEQTQTTGLANKLIGLFAHTVAIAYNESAAHFPTRKIRLTGPLLRTQLFDQTPQQPNWIIEKPNKPIIYITGGSQGSEVINHTVTQALSQLTKKWFVIHQCGSKSDKRNYLEELHGHAQKLPKNQRQRYVAVEWLCESELAWVFNHAELVISRAGANTITELRFHALPSILIPLPFAYNQEQLRNAQQLVSLGGAIILEQKKLSCKTLLTKIEQLTPKLTKMSYSLKNNQLTNGLEPFYQLIQNAAHS